MKKQILFFIIISFISLATAQSQEYLSHITFEDYDSDTDTYSEVMKETYTYNGKGQLTMTVSAYKMDTNWIESVRNEYKYNTDGNLIEEIYATKMTGSSTWANLRKNVTNYAGDTVTSEESYDWKNGNWQPDDKTILNYVGNRVESFDSFEYEDMQWKDDSRGVLTYSGAKIASLTTEELKNGVWTWDGKDIYSRHASTRIKDEIYQEWNGIAWANDEKTSYADDANGNRISETYSESEDGLTWKLVDKIEYTYDNTAFMSSYYNPYSEDSFSIGIGLIDRAHYNKILSNVVYFYEDSEWEVSGKATYYYSDDTMGLDDVSDSIFINVYPNPVTTTLNIKLKFPVEADATIYDINGRMVLNRKLQSLNTSLHIETLSAGMYVLKLRTENRFATKRITKN